VLDEMRSHLVQGASHRETILGQLRASLWVSPDLIDRIAATLDESHARVVAQCRRLEEVRAAYADLPLAEQDDGRVPEPVGAQA